MGPMIDPLSHVTIWDPTSGEKTTRSVPRPPTAELETASDCSPMGRSPLGGAGDQQPATATHPAAGFAVGLSDSPGPSAVLAAPAASPGPFGPDATPAGGSSPGATTLALDARTGRVALRCTTEWAEWLTALAAYCRVDAATTLDQAITRYAAQVGFQRLPPPRLSRAAPPPRPPEPADQAPRDLSPAEAAAAAAASLALAGAAGHPWAIKLLADGALSELMSQQLKALAGSQQDLDKSTTCPLCKGPIHAEITIGIRNCPPWLRIARLALEPLPTKPSGSR